MDAPYLTVEQVAAKLQVSERTVLQWLRAGELPGRKLGRLWRIHPGVLDGFMRVGSADRGNAGSHDVPGSAHDPLPEECQ